MKLSKTVVFLLALMPSLLFAQGYKSKTLIKLGDNNITAGEFMSVYEKNNVNGDVIDKKNVDEYLDMYINFKLKVIEAESLKMDTNAKFVKELNGYRKQLAKPYFSNEEGTEALVEEAYDRMLWDINADHILVKCDIHAVPADTLKAYNKAIEIRNRILKGEDFNALAVELSDDPSARDIKEIPGKQRAYKGNKGNLGYFSAFDMVYPFETGVYNTKVGEISMPVRTDFGYHIIRVNSKTPACGIIKAAQVFLIVDENTPGKSDSAVREKAMNIFNEIEKDGSNWDVIVKKYTDDKGAAPRGGALSPFKVNSIVPEFIDAIKEMEVGDITLPVKTNYGYHIIRLISKSGIASLDDEKDNIKKRVEKDMRAKVSDEIVLKRIMKENRYKVKTKTKDAFIATIDSTLSEGHFVLPENADVNKVLFSFEKKQYTINDFVQYIYLHQQSQPFMSPASYAYELFNDFVKESAFAYEDSKLEEKYPEFDMLVKEYHDGILLFDLMEKEVWKKAEKDTTGLNNYYEEHKGDYMWKKRVKAAVVTVNNSESLDRAVELIELDVCADTLKAAFNKERLKVVMIKVPFFQEGDNIDIDSTSWVAGTIRIVPSTVENSTKIIKILEVRDPEPKTFKEAKGLVTSAYQNVLERNWIESLKTKYPVSIDEKLLEKVKNNYN